MSHRLQLIVEEPDVTEQFSELGGIVATVLETSDELTVVESSVQIQEHTQRMTQT